MKKAGEIDLSSHQKLEEIVNKWRDIVGVDPIYLIEIIESPDNDFPAWIDGLSLDNPHPTVNMFINANWLQKNKRNEKEIISTIIHELVHIMIWDQIIQINPEYKYVGVQARANEVLTMKITKAIIHSYYNK
jgi:hypothetical protein